MTDIEKIENLHWKFPKDKTHKPLKKLRDFELQQIRSFVRKNKHVTTTWFALPSEKWFNDITLLLKHRQKSREIRQQLKKNNP